MDATFEFSFTSMNMDFAIHLAADGCDIPEGLFINIITKKCQLLHQYLKSSKDCLTLVTNVNDENAFIKIYDQDIMETPLIQFTISNLYDLEDQLYQLWIKACKVLKAYNICDPSAELRHIAHYYSSTAYEERMHACLL